MTVRWISMVFLLFGALILAGLALGVGMVASRLFRRRPVLLTDSDLVPDGEPDPGLSAIGLLRDDIWSRLSEWCNPILVKEVRQALKSRAFVSTFLLLLIACWVITLVGMMFSSLNLEHGNVGSGFFFAYFSALCVAVEIVIPFTAYRALLGERDLNTYELLSVTTLKPTQLVWGKLLGAGIQTFLFYSAIAPFIAFTSLLDGFDPSIVTILMLNSVLVSLLSCMFGLMVSTFTGQRAIQMLIAIGLLFGLLSVFSMQMSFAGSIGYANLQFDWEFFLACTLWTISVLSYFWLFFQITVAQLTFESDNRSTGIRIVALVQFWLWLGWFIFMINLLPYFAPSWSISLTANQGVLLLIAIVGGLHWTVMGMLFAFEPERLSRRLSRNLPTNPLIRQLYILLMPGGGRGFLLLLSQLFLLFICIYYLATLGKPHELDTVLQTVFDLCAYIIIYVGFGAALGRWLRERTHDFGPAHARVVTLLMFAAGTIFPIVPGALDWTDLNQQSIYNLPSPIQTLSLSMMHNAEISLPSVVILGLVAGLAIVLNLRAMINGIKEILYAPVRSRENPHRLAQVETTPTATPAADGPLPEGGALN